MTYKTTPYLKKECNKICDMYSGGGPIHARVPIQAHPQFSWRFIIFHWEDVYHIIDNHLMDHLHL